jgi:hypothetical protein
VGRAAGTRRVGLLAALLLGATAELSYTAPACLADGVAFGLGIAGITVASLRLRAWPLLAALLFSAALLVKHSFVIFPGGVAAWALLRDPRRGLILSAIAGALVLGAIARWGLFSQLVLWSVAPWQTSGFAMKLAAWILPAAAGLAAAGALVRRWPELPAEARQVLGPWVGVFCLGLPWILALGRTGAGANYTLELLTATVVLATVAGARLGHGRLLLGHAILTVAVGVGWLGHLALRTLPAAREEMAAAAAALSETDRPILTEQTWYATATGRPPLVIPFLATQLALAHRWDAAPLVDAVRTGGVGRILLQFRLDEAPGSGHADRFLPDVLAAARERYVLTRQAGELYIYAPWSDPPPAPPR